MKICKLLGRMFFEVNQVFHVGDHEVKSSGSF